MLCLPLTPPLQHVYPVLDIGPRRLRRHRAVALQPSIVVSTYTCACAVYVIRYSMYSSARKYSNKVHTRTVIYMRYTIGNKNIHLNHLELRSSSAVERLNGSFLRHCFNTSWNSLENFPSGSSGTCASSIVWACI